MSKYIIETISNLIGIPVNVKLTVDKNTDNELFLTDTYSGNNQKSKNNDKVKLDYKKIVEYIEDNGIHIVDEFLSYIKSTDYFEVVLFDKSGNVNRTCWRHQELSSFDSLLYSKYTYSIIKELRDNMVSYTDDAKSFEIKLMKKSCLMNSNPVKSRLFQKLFENYIEAYSINCKDYSEHINVKEESNKYLIYSFSI